MSGRDDEQHRPPLGEEETLASGGPESGLEATVAASVDVSLEETVAADPGLDADVGSAPTMASTPSPEGASGASPGPTPTLRKGDSLGRYLIVEPLGAGGMGVVFKGYDPELHRQVALKLLQPRARTGSGGDARARLQREAQAMAQLAHPNILTVYDVGVWQGQVYVAMELVDGVTLHEWLETSRPLAEVLDVLRQAGAGLAQAHGAELVHRDFKPDNVLVGRDGRVRVMDFGLARHVSDGEPRAAPVVEAAPLATAHSVLETPLTQAGALLGTPAYMSPEQFGGEAVDARSDQFAFGVVLHEAVFETRPFSGGTLSDLEAAVTRGDRDPPPGDHAAPTWLRDVIDRALEPSPSARFADMEALLDALVTGQRRKRRRWLAVAAGATVLLAVALGIWLQQRSARTTREKERLARQGRQKARALASTQSALKKKQGELSDTAQKLRSSAARKKKIARHLEYLKRRRAELLKELVAAPDQAHREDLSCLIAGLEDVIAVGGKHPLRAALKATFKRCYPVYRRCYRLALADDPKRAGMLKIRFHTDATGQVKKLEFLSDTIGHRAMRRCLRERLLRLRLPNGGEKTLVVTYPFYFRPAAAVRPRPGPG